MKGKKEKYDSSIEDYNKAIEINSDDEVLYNKRGDAYAKQGDYKRAKSDFEKAVQLAPDGRIRRKAKKRL